MIKYVVLAGNAHQFYDWCSYNRVNPKGEAFYVLNSEILRGHKFPNETVFVEVGTFSSRSDSREIIDMVEHHLGRKIEQGTR